MRSQRNNPSPQSQILAPARSTFTLAKQASSMCVGVPAPAEAMMGVGKVTPGIAMLSPSPKSAHGSEHLRYVETDAVGMTSSVSTWGKLATKTSFP
eukprot:1551964-Pyramimonas_sp.AAC.1